MKAQFAIACLLVLSPAALAETLVLKNGAEISGVLGQRKDSRVTIRVEGGEITLSESMVRETRKDHASSEMLLKAEEDARKQLAAANQERRERMTIAASAFDAARRDIGEARPASFNGIMPAAEMRGMAREKSMEEIGAEIEAKLELLREFEKRGLSNQMRRAILDELFPNQRSQPVVW